LANADKHRCASISCTQLLLSIYGESKKHATKQCTYITLTAVP